MKNLKPGIFIFISFTAILIVYTLKADAQNFEFGLRYNPQFTGLLNKNDANAGSSLTLTHNFEFNIIGAGAIYNINNNIGLAVDILFSREGQRFKGNFTGSLPDPATYSSVVNTQASLNNLNIVGDYVAKSELNYIKLPLMFSLTSDKTRQFFFTMLAGPQINFLYNVAQEVNHIDRDYPNSNIKPIDLYKPVTINGVIAVGAAYNLSQKFVLSARLRCDYSFDDVENKNVMVSYFGDSSVHFYSSERQATHSITEGMMLSLDYKL